MTENMTPLPKIDLPTYELIIPSSGEEIIIRPFTVKEERLLFMGLESNDPYEIIRTVKQVISNCIITSPPRFSVETAPFFDVDYLFVAMRAKSIGETITQTYRCRNKDEEGNECSEQFKVTFDISDYMVYTPDISLDLKLSEKLKVKMKYPTYHTMKAFKNLNFPLDKKISVLVNSMEYITHGDKRMAVKDYSKDEIQEFVENLPKGQFSILESFLDDLPRFYIEGTGTCLKCGKEHLVEIDDFTSFFE